jgi:hypothetical protein
MALEAKKLLSAVGLATLMHGPQRMGAPSGKALKLGA